MSKEKIEQIRNLYADKFYNMGPRSYEDMGFLLDQLSEAERRGEERAWEAANQRVEYPVHKATTGIKGVWPYPKYPTLSDWRASEEYKEGK